MPGPTIQDVLDRIVLLEAKLLGTITKRDYYNIEDVTVPSYAYDKWWLYQESTAIFDYRIDSVRLKLRRNNSPGLVTVSIRAASEGKPTGSDLCSGTIDDSVITDVSPGKWYMVSLGFGTLLSKDMHYTIVVRTAGGDSTNWLEWARHVDGTYGGGICGKSDDYGVSWLPPSNGDMMFETYASPFSSPGVNDIYSKLESGDMEAYTESQHARPG